LEVGGYWIAQGFSLFKGSLRKHTLAPAKTALAAPNMIGRSPIPTKRWSDGAVENKRSFRTQAGKPMATYRRPQAKYHQNILTLIMLRETLDKDDMRRKTFHPETTREFDLTKGLLALRLCCARLSSISIILDHDTNAKHPLTKPKLLECSFWLSVPT